MKKQSIVLSIEIGNREVWRRFDVETSVDNLKDNLEEMVEELRDEFFNSVEVF